MLEGVGITPQQERIYRALLGGEASLAALAEAVGASRTRVARDLDQLQSLGLAIQISPRPATYRAAQPDIAIGALIHRREEQHEQTRIAAGQLMSDFHAGVGEAPAGSDVETLHDFDTIKQRYIQLQLAAEHDVRIVDVPPYVVSGEPNPFELQALARGVRCRVVYGPAAFDSPNKWEYVQTCIEAGEKARLLADVPVKMQVSDANLAMVFPHGGASVTRAVVIHPSALLDALIRLFDLLWDKGTALPGATESPELAETESAILGLLAAGEKDDAIARQLGLHVRTVRRYVHELSARLGAGSRFAAGVRAARHGWV